MESRTLTSRDFDSNVMKDLKTLDEKIEKAESAEEVTKLRMAKLYRGMELNACPYSRNYRGYYPY